MSASWPATGAAFVEDIIGETDRLGRLVADLLSLASAEAGALPMHLARIDLGPWFVDLGRRAGAIAASRGVRLSVSPPGRVPGSRSRRTPIASTSSCSSSSTTPSSTRRRVASCSSRSSTSGVRATPSSRCATRARASRPRSSSASSSPSCACHGTRRSTGGAGLGLAIARQLAVRQGAELSVASAPGQGAVFGLGSVLIG